MDKEQKIEKLKKVLTKASKLEQGKELALAQEFISIDEKIDTVKESVTSISEELKKKLESELVLEIDREELKGEQGIPGVQGEQGEKGEKGDQGGEGKQGIKGNDGLDGKDGLNGENGLPGADGSPDTPKEIKDKLETLKKDKRLDVSAIKGIEKLHEDTLNRAVSILDQRTKFLINKGVKHDSTLSGDGSDASPLTVIGGGGGGGTWGSITGTLSDQTDLQSALDAKYDASNPSGYISNISGQDLSSADNTTSAFITLSALATYVPYTGATTDLDLGGYNLTAANVISTGFKAFNNTGYKIYSDPTGTVLEGHIKTNGNGIYEFAVPGVTTPYLDFSGAVSANHIYTFPNAAGTIALTSDISLATLGITATAAELNILDGATLSTTELNYVDGVTSSIQTQLNAKGSGTVT